MFGLLFAVNTGVQGLKARDKSEDLIATQPPEDKNLATAATGTTKLSTQTERVGGSLYRYASLPFEVASLLLLVAIIGSVMLARTIKQEAAVDDVAPEVLREEIKQEPELARFAAADATFLLQL